MAADVTGEWTRDDGAAKVRFSACGGEAERPSFKSTVPPKDRRAARRVN
jgi:hypothetical protein